MCIKYFVDVFIFFNFQFENNVKLNFILLSVSFFFFFITQKNIIFYEVF